MTTRVMGLRNSVRGEKKRKRNGWKGGWRDRLDIPKAKATPVLFTRGEYEDVRPDEIDRNGGVPPLKHYHVMRSHTFRLGERMFRTARCVCGYEVAHPEDKCMACRRKSEGDNRIGTRDIYSLNCLHLAPYQRIEVVDKKTGKPRYYEKDGKNHKRGDVITDWAEVTAPRDLKNLRANLDTLLEDGEVLLYKKKYVEVGYGHLNNIMAIDEMASQHCRCGGQLEPVQFTCAGCHEILVDIVDANLEPEEVQAYNDEAQRCPSCAHIGFPDRVTICDECTEPEPLTIFDGVAYIRKTGEGTASMIMCEKFVPLPEFELEDGSYLLDVNEDGDDWKYDQNGAHMLREDIAKMATQFDFEEVHRPADNEYLCSRSMLNCDNTIGGGSPRRYGATRSDDSEDEEQEESPRPAARRRPGIRLRR